MELAWRHVESRRGDHLGCGTHPSHGPNDLLLPFAQHVTGVVVDTEGRPVPEARIDHSGELRRAYLTGEMGRFQLDTRAPILMIRKAGFRSELIHTQEAKKPLRITLRKLGERPNFPLCSPTASYVGIEGWGSRLQFSPVAGVKVSPQGHDIDFGARGYYVETESGPKGIRHGSGPMWTFGIPSDRDVWQSVKYEETAYQVGRTTVLDARGQLPNGDRWRDLGKFGESASYSDVDESTARILDKFLDGACITP